MNDEDGDRDRETEVLEQQVQHLRVLLHFLYVVLLCAVIGFILSC